MPPTQQTTIPCPECQQPVVIEIWQMLDLGREPDLRRRFLQGELNSLCCSNCGTAGTVGVPMIVHNPDQEQVIFFVPDDPQITRTG